MKNDFFYNVLNEIDDVYIVEALEIQKKNRKKRRFYKVLYLIAACMAIIAGTGYLLQKNNYYDETIKETVDMIQAEVEEHSFTLVAYAAEDSVNKCCMVPEEYHEYILSSAEGKIANKYYTLVSVEEMPEEMQNRIDYAEELVMCYGFNVRIEGTGIESITFESENTEFVKKLEYDWEQNENEALFKMYPECLGVSSKEFYNGHNGAVYENCGNTSIDHWMFIPAGNKYTVPYDKQGDSEYLYALKVTYDRKQIEKANEFFHSTEGNNFHAINDLITDGVLGQEIKLTVNYMDGCKEELVIEVTHSGGMYMKVRVNEIVKKFEEFDAIKEVYNNENGKFQIKKIERTGNGWNVRYKNEE